MSVADPAPVAERVLELQLFVPIRPKGQGRPRFDPRSARAYTDNATRAYVDTLRAAAAAEWGDREPLTGPLVIYVHAAFPLPKRADGRRYHTMRPDWDNIGKSCADALQPHHVKRKGQWVTLWRGVIADDAAIVEGRVRKEWSALGGGLTIKLWSLQ